MIEDRFARQLRQGLVPVARLNLFGDEGVGRARWPRWCR